MGTIETVRTVAGQMSEDNVSFLAASIAYYAFFSIVPLLLLTLSIGSFIGGEAFAERIVGVVGEHLSSSGQELVSGAVYNPEGRAGASIVGVLGLTWSAIKVMRAVDTSFDVIYAHTLETSLVTQIKNGLTVLVLVGVGVVVMVGAGTVIGQPGFVDVPYVNVLGWIVLVVGLFVVFLPLYYVMPPHEMTVRKALPGTLIAAIGWVFLQVGFQIYSTRAANFEAYGILGGVLLFLTWLYFAAILVLLGAVVNAVLEGTAGTQSEQATGVTAD